MGRVWAPGGAEEGGGFYFFCPAQASGATARRGVQGKTQAGSRSGTPTPPTHRGHPGARGLGQGPTLRASSSSCMQRMCVRLCTRTCSSSAVVCRPAWSSRRCFGQGWGRQRGQLPLVGSPSGPRAAARLCAP